MIVLVPTPVNVTLIFRPEKLLFQKVILPFSVAPYCLILTSRWMSSPLTVMIALRSNVEKLSEAVYETVPSLEPEDGETVSHSASLLTVQFVLEVTVNVFVSLEG